LLFVKGQFSTYYPVYEKMRTMKKTSLNTAIQRPTWLSITILMLMMLSAVSCNNGSPSNGKGPGGEMSAGKKGRPGGPGKMAEVSIQTADIQKIAIQREVELAGSLVSSDQAKVSSEVAGVVRQVLVELGQEVSVGQILVKLDTQELELALQRAQSQLRQTEAQLGINGIQMKEPPPDEQISAVRLAIANRDDSLAQLRRAQRLRNQNLLPQADLDTAETKVKVNEANYRTALETVQSLKATLQDRRQAVEQARKKLNDANIRASLPGQISERLVNQGEYIRENTPVVSIVKMNPLKLETAIQERHANIVRAGLPVEFSVESAPGRKFTAKVANVSPSVDINTRTFAVEVLVDNSQRLLKPGFFAKGVIYTHRDENIMAIPEDAISTLAGISNVYIIEQGKIRQQAVSIGPRTGKLVEITGGLKGNELLAASNLTMLATGVPVKISGPLGQTSSGDNAPSKRQGGVQ
jgi:RND family efflux transporter MFP subunit